MLFSIQIGIAREKRRVQASNPVSNPKTRSACTRMADTFTILEQLDMDASESIQTYLRRIADCQTLANHVSTYVRTDDVPSRDDTIHANLPMQQQLAALETDMQNVKYLSQTEAAMNMTDYRGLVHWSKVSFIQQGRML